MNGNDMSSSAFSPAGSDARHSIAVVSRRTGVSQLLLRAWERRYGAVAPARTATGRRLYTDQELEKISLLHLLTGAGHRIGDIANLPQVELVALAGELPAAVPTAVGPASTGSAATFLAEALQATGTLDAHGLEQVLNRALLQLSKPVLRNELLMPLLQEIGERWSDGRLRVSHEHMATSIVTSFLTSLNARQPVPVGAPVVAVATPSGQHHELGALLAAAVVLEAGWDVLYLGRDLPAEDIVAAAQNRGARAVLLSLVFPLGDAGVTQELRQLRRLLGPDVAILVGGRGAASYAAVLAEISARLISGDETLLAELARI
jgi:methanogenic corrinoid protein MtbC1